MPTPNFEDAPDGSSSINHTGSTFSEENCSFWEDIDPWADIPSHQPPPHPSYADGSAPLAPVPAPATLTLEEAFHRHIAALPPTFPVNAGETVRRPGIRVNNEPYQCSPSLPPPVRRPRSRRVISDPDAAIRKDPNAWSMREAVELCKLLEVVVPEAGFHIALTGGLLYKEGRRKDCDLMFYQIRGTDPNYEILWKYLTVAGVIRSPSYPENGWLVKATYRGKAIDCLFPNAKKAKKAGTAKDDCYKAALKELRAEGVGTPTLVREAVGEQNVAVGAHSLASNNAGTCNTEIGSTFVRHNDGAPILFHRSPSAPCPYDPAELLATPAPAPVPAAAEAQYDIPF